MAAIRLEYLVFYIGNLAFGFDYVYAKRSNGHAFLLHRQPGTEIAQVTDDNFDFYNPHFSEDRRTEFNWTYDESYADMTNVWDHFAEVVFGYLENWSSDYKGVSLKDDEKNVEWGVRFKSPNFGDEEIIWGINAYPENFDDFVNYIKSFDPENPTPRPENLPFTKGKYQA